MWKVDTITKTVYCNGDKATFHSDSRENPDNIGTFDEAVGDLQYQQMLFLLSSEWSIRYHNIAFTTQFALDNLYTQLVCGVNVYIDNKCVICDYVRKHLLVRLREFYPTCMFASSQCILVAGDALEREYDWIAKLQAIGYIEARLL